MENQRMLSAALMVMVAMLGIAGARLDDREVAVDLLEAEGPTGLTVNAALRIDRLVVAEGAGFRGEVDFLAPAPGLDMGEFVEVGWKIDPVVYPRWWRLSGAVDEYQEPNDFTAASQGQVKWMAECAATVLEVALADEGGAGAEIENLIASFSSSSNLLPVALGQLKNVAEPFWNRLRSMNMADGAPWSAGGDDRAMVNVGQVKRAFAFDFSGDCLHRLLEAYADPDADSEDEPQAAARLAAAASPASAAPAAEAPEDEHYRPVEFSFGSGYASWKLKVIGDGPYDFEEKEFMNNHESPDECMVDVNLRLRKGNRYRLRVQWLDGDEDAYGFPVYDLDFTIDGKPKHLTFSREEGDGDDDYHRNEFAKWIYGEGYIIDNRSGLVCGGYRSSLTDRGPNQLADREATIYVLDDPGLVFDYDRNRVIDEDDIKCAQDGTTVFRFWHNDDFDKGGGLDSGAVSERCDDDFLGTGEENYRDSVVNGKRDLVDFTPLMIDFSRVFPEGLPKEQRRRVVWSLGSDCLNLVWTKLSPKEAGRFLIEDVDDCGPELKQSACGATCLHMNYYNHEHVEIPRELMNFAEAHGDRLVVMVEGDFYGDKLFIWGDMPGGFEDADGVLSFRSGARIDVLGVGDMMRIIDLRQACLDDFDLSRLSAPEEPINRPDSECDDLHYVFVHGYNVNYAEGMAWGQETFKRLWQAGFNSRYTMVLWEGDPGQRERMSSDEYITPNYYGAVKNAFITAEALAKVVGQLPGRKIMMAHSLGNMVVSAAARDFGMDYRRYYMLNAAVAAEAFFPGAVNNVMVDYEWHAVPNALRASHWHELFGADDFRHGLTWKGRFTGLKEVVNFFSATDEIVGRPSSLLGMNTSISTLGCAWPMQELFKGCELWEIAGGIGFTNILCQGGWGIKAKFRLNPKAYDPIYGLHGQHFKDYSREMCITNHIFTDFKDEPQLTTLERIAPDVEGAYRWRAELLGSAIPAESFAVGAGEVGGAVDNCDLHGFISGGWMSDIARLGKKWYHSDMKDRAYQYVYKLFDRLSQDSREMSSDKQRR